LDRKYLSDPTEDVRIATENQLAEFLREIKEVTLVQKQREEEHRTREDAATAAAAETVSLLDEVQREGGDDAATDSDRGGFIKEDVYEGSQSEVDNAKSATDGEGIYRDPGSTYITSAWSDIADRRSLGTRTGRQNKLRRHYGDFVAATCIPACACMYLLFLAAFLTVFCRT
jgi:hypothetical protein